MFYLLIILFNFSILANELEFVEVPIIDEKGIEYEPLQFAVKSDTILVLTTEKELILSTDYGVSFRNLSDVIGASEWTFKNFEEKIHPYSMLIYGKKYVNQIIAYTLRNLDNQIVFETQPILIDFANIAVHPKNPYYVYLAMFIDRHYFDDESFRIFKNDSISYGGGYMIRNNKITFNYSKDDNIMMNSVGYKTIFTNYGLHNSYNYSILDYKLIESDLLLDYTQHCYGCYSDYSVYLNKLDEKKILTLDFENADTISISSYEDITNINLTELNEGLDFENSYDITHSEFILNQDHIKNQIRVFNLSKKENNEFVSYSKLYYRTLDGGDNWDLVYQNNEISNPISTMKINPDDGIAFIIRGERDNLKENMNNPKLFKSTYRTTNVEINNNEISAYLSNGRIVINNLNHDKSYNILISDILGNQIMNEEIMLNKGLNEIKINKKFENNYIILRIASSDSKSYVFKLFQNK